MSIIVTLTSSFFTGTSKQIIHYRFKHFRALEEEDTAPKAVTSALITDNQGAFLKPSNNINLQYSKSSHPNENQTCHSVVQVPDGRGGRVAHGGRDAQRLSDQSSLGSGTQQITSNNTSSNKVSL